MKDLRMLCAATLLFLSGSIGLWAAQAKKGAGAQTSAAASEPTKAIAVHDYQLEGVQVPLTDVTRTAPEVVTVKWEYRNKTNEVQKLATDSHGWSDPYRLSGSTYILGEDGKTKFPLMRDEKGYPVAAVHGAPVQVISVGPKKTLKTWAKYSVPADAKKVTVVIVGAEPFESVEVAEPSKGVEEFLLGIKVRGQDGTQPALMEDKDVLETPAPNRPNQPFNVGILP